MMGDFTDEMIHPRNEIDKVYVARVKGVANKDNLRPLTRGLEIDGKKTKPAVYEILKVDPVLKPLCGAVDHPWRA